MTDGFYGCYYGDRNGCLDSVTSLVRPSPFKTKITILKEQRPINTDTITDTIMDNKTGMHSCFLQL